MPRFTLIVTIVSLIFCSSGGCADSERQLDPGPYQALYVNSGYGDDNNPGSRLRPVRTIDEVNKRIQSGVYNIYFRGGQTFYGSLLLERMKGSEKANLLIDSYGSGRAVICGGTKEAVRAEYCSSMKIKHLSIRGDGRKDGNTSDGLALISCSDIVINKIEAEGFQKSGVCLYNCRYVKVRNVLAHDNGFCGINVMGSSRGKSGMISIQGCRANNNPGDPTNLTNHSGNGILIGVSDSVTIDNCIATNNGWDMPRTGNGPVGIWAWMSDHVKIQYCISYRNKTSKGAKDGGGFDLDGGVTNSVVQFCLSYDNQGAGYGLFQYPGASDWSDNIIRYNISINDAHTTEGSGSFFIWNGSGISSQLKNCRIYNNMVFSSSAPAISFEPASLHENFVFSHNLFMGKGDLIEGNNSGSIYRGNLWIGRK